MASMMIDELGLEVVHRAPANPSAGCAVIAAPHPLYGGSLSNPVVQALAAGFGARGVGTLCFNYRGIGDSRGDASDSIVRASEDYARVLAWARAQPASASAPLYAAGYSFGAITAIATALGEHESAAPQLSALVLVAPPLALLDGYDLSRARCPSFVLVGDNDAFLPLAAARDYFARVPRCAVVENEADHFFAYELEDVRTFASNAVAVPGTAVPAESFS
jgi:alpha/beta superfamily hydrolase